MIRNRGLFLCGVWALGLNPFFKFAQQGHSRHLGRLFTTLFPVSFFKAVSKTGDCLPGLKKKSKRSAFIASHFYFCSLSFCFLDCFISCLTFTWYGVTWKRTAISICAEQCKSLLFSCFFASLVGALHMSVKAVKSFSFSLVRSVWKLTLNVPFAL